MPSSSCVRGKTFQIISRESKAFTKSQTSYFAKKSSALRFCVIEFQTIFCRSPLFETRLESNQTHIYKVIFSSLAAVANGGQLTERMVDFPAAATMDRPMYCAGGSRIRQPCRFPSHYSMSPPPSLPPGPAMFCSPPPAPRCGGGGGLQRSQNRS